jgi:hypothetical protein
MARSSSPCTTTISRVEHTALRLLRTSHAPSGRDGGVTPLAEAAVRGRLASLIDWMSLYGAFWRDRFDPLETLLDRMDR